MARLIRERVRKDRVLKAKWHVPKSKEDVRSPERETVDSAKNCGNEIEAQPVVDAGHDSGVGRWVGDAQDVRFEQDEE